MTLLKTNMKIIFFGTGDLGVPALERLIELGLKPMLVITAPDKPAGRGLKLSHSPIKEVALHAGLQIYQPEKVNDPDVVAHLRQYQADLGIIIAYGQKIGAVLINIFPHGIINLHASLLPKYRGAAPINWAIINGEQETGLTVMQINEQIDAGKILNQVSMPIDPMIRADELYVELAKLGPDLLVKTLEQIQQGTLNPQPQDPQKVTKAPKLSKAFAVIDWTLPAGMIADFIRGLWPWPGACSEYVSGAGKSISVSFARCQVVRDDPPASVEPGTILDDFTVATGAGRLKILEIKPAGSKLMNWQDFINGRRIKPGDKFVAPEKIAHEKNAVS
jgi:methionyl-tRNA formyltransferase